MPGWIVPSPQKSVKSREEFRREREEKVRWLEKHGFLRSGPIREAMLKVPREERKSAGW